MNSNLPDNAAFKAWAKQNPGARRLLKDIIFRWRGSSARLRGDPAPWAAYPLATWRGWSGLSRSTLNRRLRDLVDAGLIERERHRFGGCTIYPWLRPTRLALKYGGTPEDLARLKEQKPTSIKPASEASVEAPHEASAEAMPEATDHTFIPSSATPATKPQAPANKFTGGKGKAGEGQEWLKEMATKEVMALANEAGQKEIDIHDPDWAGIIQVKVKKLDLLFTKFPRIKGKHEKHVKHPYDLNAKWASWSDDLQAKRYAVYVEYVANWHNANGSKPNTQWKEWTAEDDAVLLDTIKKLNALDDDDNWTPGPWKPSAAKHW